MVTVAHHLRWQWLRFLTSETVLRVCSSLGTATERISFDTVRIHGQVVSFEISCTFIDVVVGALPLLWDFKKPIFREASRALAFSLIFFAFNLARLVIAQTLYAIGVPWTLADDTLGGFAYFAVWLFIWHRRTWEMTSDLALP